MGFPNSRVHESEDQGRTHQPDYNRCRHGKGIVVPITLGQRRFFRQDIEDPEDVLMRIARLYPAVEYVQSNRRRMLLMTTP